MTGVGERLGTGGNGKNPSGQEGWLWELFGSLISLGSGQVANQHTS